MYPGPEMHEMWLLPMASVSVNSLLLRKWDVHPGIL